MAEEPDHVGVRRAAPRGSSCPDSVPFPTVALERTPYP